MSKEKVIKPKRKAYEILERVEPAAKVIEKDEFDKLMEQEEKELINEAKKLKIQEIIARRKAKIKELEKKYGVEEGTIPPLLMKELVKLPEDEFQELVRRYLILKSAESPKSIALLPYLRYLEPSYRSKKSENSSTDVAKTVIEAIKTGVELAKSHNKGSDTEVYKLMFGFLKDYVEKLTKDIKENLQPRVGIMDTILLNKEIFERLKELGFLKTPTSESIGNLDPKVLLELKKLETWQKMELEKLRQQFQIEMTKLGVEKEKANQFSNMFVRLGMAAAKGLAAAGAEGEMMDRETSPNSSVETVKCEVCGVDIPVPTGATRIKCPKCGTEYEVER